MAVQMLENYYRSCYKGMIMPSAKYLPTILGFPTLFYEHNASEWPEIICVSAAVFVASVHQHVEQY